jgi:energy-coupling factor transporter ATP-binding protein EcfA2
MKLGFIPDRPFIYEKLTGVEFLRFVAGLFGQDGPKVEHRGRELLALFDLEEWRDELVESYSHGMRQKLIISSAFIHRPDVIVVDEPMVGLDPKAARILKDLFREYVQRGHTIVMSTPSGVGLANVVAECTALGQLRMRFGSVPLSGGPSGEGSSRISVRSAWHAARTASAATTDLMHAGDCDLRASDQPRNGSWQQASTLWPSGSNTKPP